jgi:cell division protein FtsL
VRHAQRLFWEHDPCAPRRLVAALACSALLAGGALAVVGARVQQVHLAYRLDDLRTRRTHTEANVRQLEIEVATLASPRRVELRARQLGMTAPERDQIRLAREFVPGTTGLAGIRSRTALLAAGVAIDATVDALLHDRTERSRLPR